MSDIAILQQMINPTTTVLLEKYHSKNKVTLKEPPPADYSVTIYDMPDQNHTIVIKADTFISPKAVFANLKGECKRADFVVIADTDKKKIIICIEMKAGKGGLEQEIIQQLKGSQCFVAYCREIGRSFWDQPDFLNGYEYRFVSIRNISIPKKPTRISTKTGTHDDPARMLKISSPHHLNFHSLL